jgi:hypothetical protein
LVVVGGLRFEGSVHGLQFEGAVVEGDFFHFLCFSLLLNNKSNVFYEILKPLFSFFCGGSQAGCLLFHFVECSYTSDYIGSERNLVFSLVSFLR